MRRGRTLRAAAALGAVAAFLGCVAVAAGLPPFTTAPKVSPARGGQAEVYSVVARCHPSFDRFVIRARFATPGYDVRYLRVIPPPPSGMPVSLVGHAKLHVRLEPARAHTLQGGALMPRDLRPPCSNLRQIKLVEDFEGVVRFGLGLRRRTGFRVFRLTHPTRVVVDVLR